MLPRFRFINVYFGDLLERFLEAIGNKLEPPTDEKKHLILNQVGNRGKLSTYKVPISLIKDFKLKLIAYILSWIFKIFGKFLSYKSYRENQIVKLIFYLIFFKR